MYRKLSLNVCLSHLLHVGIYCISVTYYLNEGRDMPNCKHVVTKPDYDV